MNLVEATIENGKASFGGFEIPLRGEEPPAGTVILGIRPQDFEELAFADPSLPTIEVEATVVEELGSESHVIFPIDAPVVDADPLHAAAGNEEQAVLVADDRQSLFTATVNPASKVRPGSRLTLAVDSSRFHFFDVDSGESLTERQLAAV